MKGIRKMFVVLEDRQLKDETVYQAHIYFGTLDAAKSYQDNMLFKYVRTTLNGNDHDYVVQNINIQEVERVIF